MGEVSLGKYGVNHVAGRQEVHVEKAKAIPAIKSTIENVRIVYLEENHKNKNIDTAVIAAKATIDGDPAYVGVVVTQHMGGTRG